jgi:signal transduction histidine kinase
MAIAHDAAAPSEPRRRNLVADNPLVRAVGRVPLPLGAKLITGFAVVAALLAVVAVLGLVALNKSNSRGIELPKLKRDAAYEHVLNADARNLKDQIQFLKQTWDFRSYDPRIAARLSQLCEDAGGGDCGRYPPYHARFPVTLDHLAPRLYKRLEDKAQTFYQLGGAGDVDQGAAQTSPRPSNARPILRQEARFAATFVQRISALNKGTREHLKALIVANRRSYIHSRNLLIGVGAGSFALAVALGLLLAASVVAPLGRIRGQLAAIAGGDFAGHAKVANRDEIGALAADVNQMSEELQRAYRELELASEHKSEFLATMSHELRTPLNAIIGFSEVLQEQMFGELNERQIAYVRDVLAAGRHLLSLINDVLDLAKIEAGKMELELSQVAVPDVLRAAVSIHSERASRSGVALAVHHEPDEITITADERRVRQVVFNLLSNAVKFTPADGRIDVSARLDDGQVEIAVADTGAGHRRGRPRVDLPRVRTDQRRQTSRRHRTRPPPLPQTRGTARWASLGRKHTRPRQHLPLHPPCQTGDHSLMDVTHEPVESAPEPRRRSGWAADNALVRAVGRVHLPLGAKLLIGFAIVGALLAAGYVLGLAALSQSNTRGEQLRQLQQRAVYLQLVLADATTLQNTIDHRIYFAPTSTTRFGSGIDQAIKIDMSQLCHDSGYQCLIGVFHGPYNLGAIDPKAFRMLTTSLPIFYRIVGYGTGAGAGSRGSAASILSRADRFAKAFKTEIGALADRTTASANALVAANHGSYGDSRDLLIGLGAGSLALALAIGLLLSWSVVGPLRRTEERLVEIGKGDFSGRLDVSNRDEIGSLARRVNQTSDELQRVYRELEVASEHKSQFLATMSHELRTPLNAIIGFSEVLQEQMFGELNERQLGYVTDVLEAGRHLLSLINDVLDLAKIEAGKMELELSQVAVSDVLRSAVSMHSERASRSGLELNLTTEPDQITITADERRFRQIVFNLLSNAVKFTPPDGRVRVSARLDDGQVEIAVADTGPGIAAADLETIFEEFEQTTEGREAEGTGLGLPLSRKLVELHGGRIWAESEPGHGSIFRFTLPSRQEAS